jgi:hypothetical protein
VLAGRTNAAQAATGVKAEDSIASGISDALEQDQDAELMLVPLLLFGGPAVRTVLVVS